MNLGEEIQPKHVTEAPDVQYDADPNSFYALVFTDPDAPSRKNPIRREWHHWLVRRETPHSETSQVIFHCLSLGREHPRLQSLRRRGPQRIHRLCPTRRFRAAPLHLPSLQTTQKIDLRRAPPQQHRPRARELLHGKVRQEVRLGEPPSGKFLFGAVRRVRAAIEEEAGI